MTKIISTWYRTRLTDGTVWCEGRSRREVIQSKFSAPTDVVFESFSVLQYETEWTHFKPTAVELAEGEADQIAEDEAFA